MRIRIIYNVLDFVCYFGVDIILSIEFDNSCNHLATGDRGDYTQLDVCLKDVEFGHLEPGRAYQLPEGMRNNCGTVYKNAEK
ncbi:hypothetical protein AgCh_021866 [Apium graveolens]